MGLNQIVQRWFAQLEADGMVQKGGTRPGAGRKPNAPEDQTRPRSIRLNDARWEKLKRLIKAGKLNSWIDRAKVDE